jgi:hypothetical protein
VLLLDYKCPMQVPPLLLLLVLSGQVVFDHVTLVKVAPVVVAPLRLASVRLAPVRLALVRLAPLRLAPVRSLAIQGPFTRTRSAAHALWIGDSAA